MLPRRFSSEAIVLARKKYSEADRIITVYSRDYGKLSFIAKGVRKPKSRKRGSLEVFSHIKFAASRGKALDVVTEVEEIETFSGIRKDLKRLSVAYFLLETINKLTREEEQNKELFKLVLGYLKRLEKTKKLRSLRKQFVSQSLVLLGFWPEGRQMDNPDQILENVVEREMSSVRVGKKVLSS